LGKPLLLVEHHAFFRDKGFEFRRALSAVNAMKPDVQWLPLGEIATRVHLARSADGIRHIRFFAREFTLSAPPAGMYRLSREHHGTVRTVNVNGSPVDFAVRGPFIECEAEVAPNAPCLRVSVHGASDVPKSSPAPSAAHHARVAIRRILSEFRDNYLDVVNPWPSEAP
jgi:hypothetical protein